MMMKLFNRKTQASLALLFSFIFVVNLGMTSNIANAADGCKFGQYRETGDEDSDGNYVLPNGDVVTLSEETDDDGEDIYLLPDGTEVSYLAWGECLNMEWFTDTTKDGFSNKFELTMFGDIENSEIGDITTELLTITCENKKLSVSLLISLADRVGNRGKGEYRFDKGPILTLNYFAGPKYEGPTFENPRNFLASFLQSKKVAFKIKTWRGTQYPMFPKANLSSFRSKFAKLGCKF